MTEDQLYKEIFARLPQPPGDVVVPPGDDCAGIRLPNGRILLMAVDQTVGGRHYYEDGPEAAFPSQVARKLLGRNLSDIAAMGGIPKYALTAISQHEGVDWLRQFYDGLLEMCREFDIYPIGGDWAASRTENVCSLSIIGEVEEPHLVQRSGAADGDSLFVTGTFGSSLKTGHHLTFTPRVREGQWLAQHGFSSAMIDVSDGLLLDAQRLCTASGTAACIDPDKVPKRTTKTSWRQALTDGEDYELLFTVSRDRTVDLESSWPFGDVPLTAIGTVRKSGTPEVTDLNGGNFDIQSGGYDHVSGTP